MDYELKKGSIITGDNISKIEIIYGKYLNVCQSIILIMHSFKAHYIQGRNIRLTLKQ